MTKIHNWSVGQTFTSVSGGILEILSFDGYTHCYVTCSKCHSDKELFPEPLRVNKYKMKNGQQVCGCGEQYYWTEKQYRIKVIRECNQRDYTFIGWKGGYKKTQTTLKLLCAEGHEYNTTIESFTGKRKRGCNICGTQSTSKKLSRPIYEVENTLNRFFYKNSRYVFLGWENGIGYTASSDRILYLDNTCGTEDSISFIALYRNKSSNIRGCGGYDDNKVGYFYLSLWEKEDYAHYKFGITNLNVESRFKKQKKLSGMEGQIIGYIKFECGEDARALEVYIKRLYKHNNTIKDLFPDGYSETIVWDDPTTLWGIVGDIASLTGVSFLSNENHKPVGLQAHIDFKGDYEYISYTDTIKGE